MIRPLAIGLLIIGVLPIIGNCGMSKTEPERVAAKSQAVGGKYNWLQFGGDSTHSGNNTLETSITPQNVSQLKQLFKINLPETIEGAPVVATNVSTSSGVHDIAFITTRSGYIVALDAYSGQTLWSQQPSSTNITMSSPAVDPSLAYVYSNGLDGYLHKYAIGTGVEVTGGGWPELSTLKTQWEKGGTAITIATVNGTSYLYMGVGGYDGDGGDYEGHVTTVNLSTGAQTVFNAMCSNQPNVHFTATTPDCTAGNKGGVWAKAGVTFDPLTNRLYVGTGNGTFSPSSFLWGDSLLALNPDGTGVNGGPLDSYTPSNYQTLQNSDLDLGSTNTLILANNGSKYPHLAAQSGKDAMLRLINLDNMSGQGAPGHVAGEVYATALPTAGEVQNPNATWTNPADGSTWIFVVSPSNGMNALRLAVDGSGNPSLVPVWQQTGGGGGAHVANGVLYFAQNANVQALNPTTGALLWNNTATGQIHWQTPVVVNGVMYLGDNGRQLTAFSLSATPPPQDSGTSPPPVDAGSSGVLSRTGWVATASSDGGGAPANALDGNETTRWSTGVPQANGEWFQVDMTAAQTFDQITIDAGPSTDDYPVGYQVFVSNDGVNFGSPIATGAGTTALVTVTFAAQTARYIKVVETGATSYWWSIAEFNVYNTGAPPPPAPQPPGNLVATADSSSSIGLTWTASPTSGVTYSVFRSLTGTFTPSVNNQIQSGLTTLSFTDTGLTATTTYYYYVEALDSGGNAASNEASVATSPACTTGCATVQIDCGGTGAAPFVADEDFTGGATIDHANTIDLSAVTNPAPAAVYQSARVDNFSYTVSGFVAGSSHTIRLHFAETYFSTAGSRTFDVSINGTQVLTSFDVYLAAGAKNKAIVEQFTENASTSGSYLIQFTSVVNNSLISGIEIQ